MKQKTTKSKIKPKQIEILVLLYRFRYLNRVQIQTMLNQKYHSRVMTWLNELVDKKYIEREFNKKLAAVPSIYSLTPASRSILKDNPQIQANLLNRIWRDKTYTDQFRDHCLFLASIYLSLLSFTKVAHSTLHYYTKPDLYGTEYLIKPAPDAYFAIEGKDGQIKRYFLDLFDDLPPRVLRARVAKYLKYYDSDEWQSSTDKPFPEIILVCPNIRMKGHLYLYIKNKLDEDEEISFYLTTKDTVKEKGISRETLEKVERLD